MPELSRGDLAARLTHVQNGSNQETATVLRAILAGDTPVAANSGAQPAAIADISNAATGTQIATAVNGILAALRAFGVIAT